MQQALQMFDGLVGERDLRRCVQNSVVGRLQKRGTEVTSCIAGCQALAAAAAGRKYRSKLLKCESVSVLTSALDHLVYARRDKLGGNDDNVGVSGAGF